LQPTKILAVDDSPLIHKMYDVIVAEWPLVHATDGVEALEMLAEHPDIDLVLLDLNMPRMNGFEVLAYLKAHPVFARIPVIIISSESDPERGLAAGAAAFLRKPFQHETVRAVIARLDKPGD
jgi:CheY-like chemotaxis protein